MFSGSSLRMFARCKGYDGIVACLVRNYVRTGLIVLRSLVVFGILLSLLSLLFMNPNGCYCYYYGLEIVCLFMMPYCVSDFLSFNGTNC